LLYLGAALIVAGAILLYVGAYEVMNVILCPNIPNVCPNYAIYYDFTYIGFAMILVGVGMLSFGLVKVKKFQEAEMSPSSGASPVQTHN
jgi:hypothetical protein